MRCACVGKQRTQRMATHARLAPCTACTKCRRVMPSMHIWHSSPATSHSDCMQQLETPWLHVQVHALATQRMRRSCSHAAAQCVARGFVHIQAAKHAPAPGIQAKPKPPDPLPTPAAQHLSFSCIHVNRCQPMSPLAMSPPSSPLPLPPPPLPLPLSACRSAESCTQHTCPWARWRRGRWRCFQPWGRC